MRFPDTLAGSCNCIVASDADYRVVSAHYQNVVILIVVNDVVHYGRISPEDVLDSLNVLIALTCLLVNMQGLFLSVFTSAAIK